MKRFINTVAIINRSAVRMETISSVPTGSRAIVIFFILLTVTHASAQSFRLMRYDEDYKTLKDSSRNFYNCIKYLPLSKGKQVYISFGGEMRYEYDAYNNEDWGQYNQGHDNFFLQRYDLHADLHLNNRIRIFAQLRSSLEDGKKGGPSPLDEDKLNIQNIFADAVLWRKNQRSITARIGKQELDYGSGRLISVREGLNARLYFTGSKMMYVSPRLFIDAFVMKEDSVKFGVFDNKSSKQINLWGSYATWIIPRGGNFDFFYLGIKRDSSEFEEGTKTETRHTLGMRFWKYGGGFIYNLEASYQFGKFGEGIISAWGGAVEFGYYFENWKFKPKLNLRNDYISGDRYAGDGNLETFNPMYPKGGYFGYVPQIGPANLIDIHPYITLTVLRNLVFTGEAVFNWRYSLMDGLYRPSGGFNIPGASSKERHIGNTYGLSINYGFNKFLSCNAGLQYFKTGSFIDDIIPDSRNGVFFSSQLVFMF